MKQDFNRDAEGSPTLTWGGSSHYVVIRLPGTWSVALNFGCTMALCLIIRHVSNILSLPSFPAALEPVQALYTTQTGGLKNYADGTYELGIRCSL